MFNSTIWIRHDSETSAHMHEDPVDCLRDRVMAMEHNLDTLRTHLTQVADLRDAQGIREDHRAVIERLNEVEECATVHTLREFMSKICRLEAMFTGEDGGVIFEAIRACNRRIDSQKNTLDDFYARIRAQEDEEMENQPGSENRSSGRRRLRGDAPHRRTMRQWTRPMPRPPSPENDASIPQDTDRTHAIPAELMQQRCNDCLPLTTSVSIELLRPMIATAVEVQDELDELRLDIYRKLKEMATGLNNLRESVRLIEKDKDESWEAVSHKVSTLVEDSVGSLTERLTELEHTVQSQGTTPVTEQDKRSSCWDCGVLLDG